MATSEREMPMGYTSRSNSSSGSVEAPKPMESRVEPDSGSAREDGNHSCMPRQPYVHHGISTSP